MPKTYEDLGRCKAARGSSDAPFGQYTPLELCPARGQETDHDGRRPALRAILPFAPLAFTVAVFGLIGCGSGTHTVDTVHVEHSIAASILSQHHIEVAVSCPAGVQIEAGRGFTCVAKLEVGTYPVRAIEINDSGRVRYANQAPLVVLNVAAVKQAIARSLLSERHALAVVSCPTEILQKKSIFFTCSATAGSHRRAFNVTEIDDSGHVRYAEAH